MLKHDGADDLVIGKAEMELQAGRYNVSVSRFLRRSEKTLCAIRGKGINEHRNEIFYLDPNSTCP